jgi:hypothetical protein
VAERLSVRGADVKLRHPWGVFFLALVTLGIYYFVWYYKINRELRDYGRSLAATNSEAKSLADSSPLLSLLAILIGWILIVIPFISMFRTFGRIRTAQEITGVPWDKASPWIGLLLYFVALILLPFELVYGQTELNRLWQTAAAPAAAQPAPATP